jgi:hypothetical protein
MEKKIFTLELTEEQAKWVRIALDANGDIQDERGHKNRANFLYKLAEKLRDNDGNNEGNGESMNEY